MGVDRIKKMAIGIVLITALLSAILCVTVVVSLYTTTATQTSNFPQEKPDGI